MLNGICDNIHKQLKPNTMKKLFTLWTAMLITCMVSAQVSTWDGSWEPWTHGTGTETDPFLIENAQQLAYLAYRVNNGLDAGGGHVSNHDLHYKLMVDVDLNGSETFQWTPIGHYGFGTYDYQTFGGYFDGNGHAISGLFLQSISSVGLFYGIENATIKNIKVIGDTISGVAYSGGLVCSAYNSNIINCYSNIKMIRSYGTTDRPYAFSGGLIGYATNCIITNCFHDGEVFAENQYFGIGYANEYYIEYHCTSVSGGLVGYSSNCIISNCYNTGNLSALSFGNNNGKDINDRDYYYSKSYSSGILGRSCEDGENMTINCYNVGNISANSSGYGYHHTYLGGVVDGYNCIVDNCYYLNTCNGSGSGTSMSSDAMLSQEFVSLLNNGYCAWEYDFNNANFGYPVLNGIVSSAFTKPATSIAATTATLNGSIILENTSVITKGFEYRISGTVLS